MGRFQDRGRLHFCSTGESSGRKTGISGSIGDASGRKTGTFASTGGTSGWKTGSSYLGA